ncbi:MAG TPA: transposase, partial [Kofleriaceae bacterium]|nr:transposase [Kofleriaceae bacterium]
RRQRMVQLTLDEARRPCGRGGWRPGAGRPRGRSCVAHERRVRFAARFPVHVTLRLKDDVPSLRRHGPLRIIQQVIRETGHHAYFRIVHFAVIGNHIHFIVEADGAEALARGTHSLECRLARRLNRHFGRRGKVFADRYHARHLETPTETRNAIRYVLSNHRAHEARRGQRLNRDWVDPFSSACWFDGWKEQIRLREPRQRELVNVAQPTAAPTVWLLTTGWRRSGPLAFDELGANQQRPLAGR